MEKIEVIYDYDGYKNPKITKEGKKGMEEHKLRNINSVDAKKLLELVDQKDIDIEDILSFLKKFIKRGKGESEMTDQTNDERRFTAEEIKVNKYLELHKGENLTYRDAVLVCLDRTEPEPKKVFTEEEIKKRENLKAVENYISANPRATYKEAVRVVLRGEELTLEEKLIEEYLSANPKATYKEAVIESLSLLQKEE